MQQTSVQKQNKTNNNLGGFQMKKFIKNLLNKRLNNEKGLTLIELLAVIVILAIIAAIAVPAIGNIIQNSRDKAVLSEALNIISGAKIASMDGVCDVEDGTTTCDETALKNYVEGVTGEGVEYTAEYDGADWKLTEFTKFGEIPTDSKYTITAGETATETAIKKLLDSKNED